MPLDVIPNQDFLKFITIQGDKKNFKNLELLLNLEIDYPDMLMKVMSNFDKAKSYRQSLDKDGKPIRVPWKEALKKFYFRNMYKGVSKENVDIAELFGGKGLSQETFDEATELRKKAREASVPEHILGKHLIEETREERIERLKEQENKEFINANEMIEELYNKQFTYEWLSKNDPHNAILGLFCSCCGTITNVFYGKDIACASIIAPDVQNLIVKNLKGDIISKGTMYINKKRGYAVINDFELSREYRKHELEKQTGRYNVKNTSNEEQKRELIFKAFQRGLRAFIEEYDKQNPENPLKQVNIGMGFNKLKKQVERFKKATMNLTVPEEYSFQDAMDNDQYILYQRDEKQIEGCER